jgi:hypothetical protein
LKQQVAQIGHSKQDHTATGALGSQCVVVTDIVVIVVIVADPLINMLYQFVNRLAAVVASDCFVHVPPDPFDRVGFRSIFWEKVNFDPVTPDSQILGNFPTVMKSSVVTDHMDLGVSAAAKNGTFYLLTAAKKGTFYLLTWRVDGI